MIAEMTTFVRVVVGDSQVPLRPVIIRKFY